jgi:hypothetical protein
MGVWVGGSMAGTKQDAISKSTVDDGGNAASLSRIAKVLKDRNKRTAETLNAAEAAENIERISAFSGSLRPQRSSSW